MKVLASGSAGNAYVLDNILIECGIPYNKILKAIDYKFKEVKGCLVTHGHLQ